jgi:NAD dependent epimerase/dehydratase
MKSNSNNVLITGGNGFIGSHLVEFLIKKNFNVISFDRYNIHNSLGWLENSPCKKKIKFILGDIRDYDSVYKALKECRSVIHLAALIGIPYSYVSPSAYIKTNVEGTYNVLEAAKNLNIKNVLVTSTSEVYGTAYKHQLSENDLVHAQSPYAASKIAADQLAMSYYLSFNLPVKIIRPFNTFGPRQSLRAVIPTVISQILEKKRIGIGNIDSTRDFTFVKDLCDAFYKIHGSKKCIGQILNVGSGKEISIKNLINKVNLLTSNKVKTNIEKKRLRPKKSEVNRLLCNNSKIKKLLKWKNEYSFEKGLIETIEWFKKKENLTHYTNKNYNI